MVVVGVEATISAYGSFSSITTLRSSRSIVSSINTDCRGSHSPTHLEVKEEAEMLKKVALHSLATASSHGNFEEAMSTYEHKGEVRGLLYKCHNKAPCCLLLQIQDPVRALASIVFPFPGGPNSSTPFHAQTTGALIILIGKL